MNKILLKIILQILTEFLRSLSHNPQVQELAAKFLRTWLSRVEFCMHFLQHEQSLTIYHKRTYNLQPVVERSYDQKLYYSGVLNHCYSYLKVIVHKQLRYHLHHLQIGMDVNFFLNPQEFHARRQRQSFLCIDLKKTYKFFR